MSLDPANTFFLPHRLVFFICFVLSVFAFVPPLLQGLFLLPARHTQRRDDFACFAQVLARGDCSCDQRFEQSSSVWCDAVRCQLLCGYSTYDEDVSRELRSPCELEFLNKVTWCEAYSCSLATARFDGLHVGFVVRPLFHRGSFP